MRSSNRLGDYIELVSNTNADMKYGLDDIRGVSSTKQIMFTKARSEYADISKFYIVQPNEFVFNPRTSRNGEKIGIVFNNTDAPLIFSFNNIAFRIKDECKNSLLAEYLYMFFLRSEFDRYARYKSYGSSTELFTWTEMCAVELPVPDIEKQRKIVKAYKSITDRIELKQRINDNLEELIMCHYHLLFDSDAAKNECTIGDFGEIISGATPSTAVSEYFCTNGIAWLTPKDLTATGKKFIYKGETDISQAAYDSCSTKLLPKGTVLLTSRAPVGTIALAMNDVCTNQGFKSIVPKKEIGAAFVYCFLKDNKSLLDSHASGTTFMEVSGNVLKAIPAFIPSQGRIQAFNSLCDSLFHVQQNNELEIDRLLSAQQTIIAMISSR